MIEPAWNSCNDLSVAPKHIRSLMVVGSEHGQIDASFLDLPLAALLRKSAKDIDRREHKTGAWTYRSEPFQIDVENLGAAVKVR